MITKTVMAVKKYLDGELAKYETWEDMRGEPRLTPLVVNKAGFLSAKKGVGRDTILKFLGGNWTKYFYFLVDIPAILTIMGACCRIGTFCFLS